MATPLIAVESVGHTAHRGGLARQVLRDATFEVGPGEFVALTGLPGAGKTTLLHIIAGLLRPDAGSVRLRAQPRQVDELVDAGPAVATSEARRPQRLLDLLGERAVGDEPGGGGDEGEEAASKLGPPRGARAPHVFVVEAH